MLNVIKMTTQILTSISPSSWHNVFEYRYRNTVNNEDIYGLWHIGDGTFQSNNSVYSIKVNSSHVWSDNGSNDPVSVDVNGIYIELKDSSGTVLYRFIAPNPPSSGGGGGSSSSTTSAKVFCNFW